MRARAQEICHSRMVRNTSSGDGVNAMIQQNEAADALVRRDGRSAKIKTLRTYVYNIVLATVMKMYAYQ